VLADGAHSGGVLETVGSGGFALAVVGLCLLICRTPARIVLLPVRAVGSMPLTAYVGQIVAWAVWASLPWATSATVGLSRPAAVLAVRRRDARVLHRVGPRRRSGPLERALAYATRAVIRG
jgi:uncharacterized membrane protein YeiB